MFKIIKSGARQNTGWPKEVIVAKLQNGSSKNLISKEQKKAIIDAREVQQTQINPIIIKHGFDNKLIKPM